MNRHEIILFYIVISIKWMVDGILQMGKNLNYLFYDINQFPQ